MIPITNARTISKICGSECVVSCVFTTCSIGFHPVVEHSRSLRNHQVRLLRGHPLSVRSLVCFWHRPILLLIPARHTFRSGAGIRGTAADISPPGRSLNCIWICWRSNSKWIQIVFSIWTIFLIDDHSSHVPAMSHFSSPFPVLQMLHSFMSYVQFVPG